MDTKEQSLSIDSQHEAKTDLEACEIETPQVASHDPWYQVGFVLITSLNSAYALGYSEIVMVPLGWVGGTLGLIAAALISLYANSLLARLHETGGIRHSRYRDLAGHIYGRKMYYLTWTLQYINLFLITTGFIILAGQALKAIYTLHNNDAATLKLPYCIAITGIICSIFAFGIPHLSALRLWLGVSTFLSCIYIISAIGLSIRDGLNSPARDYEISSSGSSKSRMFGTIGAAANLIFAFNSGMLPEIQV